MLIQQTIVLEHMNAILDYLQITELLNVSHHVKEVHLLILTLNIA